MKDNLAFILHPLSFSLLFTPASQETCSALSFKLVLRRAGEATMTYSNQATATAVLLKKLVGITALLFFLFSLSIDVFAQNGATIKGRVADERGSAIPGAEVRL